MGPRRDRLETAILELFKTACSDGRSNVAEHLLRALEAIDSAGTSAMSGTERPALAEAYREIARQRP